MIPIATPGEMRSMDQRTIRERGVPGLTLMERAAEAVARQAASMLPPGGRMLVLCGGGDNGGDGLAAARLLHRRGYAVSVALLTDPTALRGDAAVNFHRLPVPVRRGFDPTAWSDPRPDLVVDALLGTGLDRDVTGEIAAAIGWINGSGLPVLSVDIPSGIDGTTGAVRGRAVRASATVTFGCPKRGCLLYPGREYAGTLTTDDIGISPDILDQASCRAWEAANVAARLPARPSNTHKGHYGHVAVVAGSEGMMGAGALASLAALRAGAGLSTWLYPRDAAANPAWEVMTRPIAGRDGAFSEQSADAALRALEGKTVLAMGPGLGRAEGTAALVRRLAIETAMPLVLDADGIIAMAGHDEALRSRGRLCLTPHPGELSRFTGAPVAQIVDDMIGHAQRAAERTGAVVLLKGASSVIAAPDGRLVINTTGNAGLATGGSGDVLTGIIAGLAAQGAELFEAAVMGAWLHGKAGDIAAAKRGMRALIASDLIDSLPAALMNLREESQ